MKPLRQAIDAVKRALDYDEVTERVREGLARGAELEHYSDYLREELNKRDGAERPAVTTDKKSIANA